MIEPTDEMRKAFRSSQAKIGCGCDTCLDVRLAAVLAIVERDWNVQPNPNAPLPLAVGRIPAYCGRAKRLHHPGHVWVTEPGRWCPGVEERP